VYSLGLAAVSGSSDIHPERRPCPVHGEMSSTSPKRILRQLSEKAGFLQKTTLTQCTSHGGVRAPGPSKSIPGKSPISAAERAHIVCVLHCSQLHTGVPRTCLCLSRMAALSPFLDAAAEEKNERAGWVLSKAVRVALGDDTEPFGNWGLSIENCYQ